MCSSSNTSLLTHMYNLVVLFGQIHTIHFLTKAEYHCAADTDANAAKRRRNPHPRNGQVPHFSWPFSTSPLKLTIWVVIILRFEVGFKWPKRLICDGGDSTACVRTETSIRSQYSNRDNAFSLYVTKKITV
jgi:hypothetical protein